MEYPLIFLYGSKKYVIDEEVAIEFMDMLVNNLTEGIRITEQDLQKYIKSEDVEPAIRAIHLRLDLVKTVEFYWRFTDADYYDDMNSMTLYSVEQWPDGKRHSTRLLYIDLTE